MRNVVRTLSWGVLALLMAFDLLVPAVAAINEFRWSSVGSSPYRCKTCTPEQAIAWTGFPSDVQQEFLRKISRREFTEGWIHGGERYSGVTFARKGRPAYESNVLLAWDSRKSYKTNYYVVLWGETEHRLHQVHACSNWVWGTGTTPRVIIPPPALEDEVIAFVCPPEKATSG